MRHLIVFLFIFSGSLKAYSAKSSSASLPVPLTERLEQAKQAKQAVWMIGNRITRGTAFFVSPNHIVTNWHVIFDRDVSSLSLRRGGESAEAVRKKACFSFRPL